MPIAGYQTPAPQTVAVTAGQTTTVQGTFTQNGGLRVMTGPAVPATVYVNGVPHNDWGTWLDFPAGTHTVCFGDVPGYTTPTCQDVTIMAGNTTTVTGNYTASP